MDAVDADLLAAAYWAGFRGFSEPRTSTYGDPETQVTSKKKIGEPNKTHRAKKYANNVDCCNVKYAD